MMEGIDKARQFAQVPAPNVFAQKMPPLPDGLLASNDPVVVTVTLAAGETLYAQGQSIPDFFLIRTGHVKLSLVGGGGNELITDLLAAGALFGPGLTTAQHAIHTATAKSETTLLRFPREILQRLMPNHLALASLVVTQLADRLQGSERRLQAMQELDVGRRLALALRDLAVEAGHRCTHGYEVDVPITQQELADLVGASRPAVSLELNAMRRRGWLSYTRRFICLDQPEAMLDRVWEAPPSVSKLTDMRFSQR